MPPSVGQNRALVGRRFAGSPAQPPTIAPVAELAKSSEATVKIRGFGILGYSAPVAELAKSSDALPV